MIKWSSLNTLYPKFFQLRPQRFFSCINSPKTLLQARESTVLIRDRALVRNGLLLNAKLHSASPREGSKMWYIVVGSSLVVGAGLYMLKGFSEEKGHQPVKTQKVSEAKKQIFVDLPKEVPYLIIGAGTAAFAASRSIRGLDVDAKVLIVGDEMHPPYSRPPLSKELWFTEDKKKVDDLMFQTYAGKHKTIFFEKNEYFCAPKDLDSLEHGGTAVALGLRASKIDVVKKVIHFTNGQSIAYQKCLVATGGAPKNLPIFKNAEKEVSERITLFRTIDDFKYLNELTKKVKKIVIVGGGFMGSELACALGKRADELKTLQVVQIFPESGNMGLVFPEYLSKWATEKVREEGVQVLTGKQVAKVRFDKKNKNVILGLDDGSELSAEHIIVSVGLDPNIELARESGLEVDPKLGGFLVNAELEARSDLWVAGDAACFYDPRLGRRRVEHHDHAVVSGRLAGENMTGARKPYWHQSMFWSDLGAMIGYEAIGLVDSSLPTISVFAKAEPTVSLASNDAATMNKDIAKEQSTATIVAPSQPSPLQEVSFPPKTEEFGKGIIFYLKDDIVVGVLLWNVFNRIPVARQIIKEGKKFEDYSEVAKLFHLFGEPKKVEIQNATQ